MFQHFNHYCIRYQQAIKNNFSYCLMFHNISFCYQIFIPLIGLKKQQVIYYQ